MSIIRTIHNKENPFTMINKKALWDKDLTLEAVGLWARLLSRPNNWEISVKELCKSCACGRDKIRTLLNELEKSGYAYRYQTRKTEKQNQFGKYDTFIFEEKISPEEIKKMFTETENPSSSLLPQENPSEIKKMFTETPFTAPENPPPTNTNLTEIDTKISPPLLSPPKPEPPSKKSLRSEEEEISPYEILKDCPLTKKEKVRLTKAYSKEQVEKAISVSKKQKVKKSFMGLMLAILKNPEDWPGMIQDEDVNFEQNLAFKYNERLKKMYPNLYSENKKLIKNNIVKLVTSTGVEQISLASSYAQNDIQSAELYLC